MALQDFTEFTHFDPKGNRWSPSEKVPDAKLGFCFWVNGSGHPGNKDAASAAQWTAPSDATVQITTPPEPPAAAEDDA